MTAIQMTEETFDEFVEQVHAAYKCVKQPGRPCMAWSFPTRVNVYIARDQYVILYRLGDWMVIEDGKPTHYRDQSYRKKYT